MKDELNDKDTPTRGPGRKQQPNGKDLIGDPSYEKHFDEEPLSGREGTDSDYGQRLKEWEKRSPRETISPQEAWDQKKRDFVEGITMISPFFLLASVLCLVPEYFVWKIHFEQWQKVYDFEPSLMTLAALLAFGTVASMAVSWHSVIECWQHKRRTGRIGGGLLAVTVMMILTFAALFTFESMAFYEFMRRDTINAFGEAVPGKSHTSALTGIGSWGGLNFVIGFITGFCTSHITSKE